MKNYLKVFNNPKKIFRAVCIGSSITSQEWCHPNWVNWLNFTFRETDSWQEDWRKKIINSGKDGATIRHFIDYFDDEVRIYKPHVVIVSVGMNCLLPSLNEKETENTLRKLFQKIKDINSDLISWSPYAIPKKKFNRDLARISTIYKEVTEEFNGVFIDMYEEFLKYNLNKLFTFRSDGNKTWKIKPGKKDFLHCNPVGCQIIAEKIAKGAFNVSLSDWEFGTMKLQNLNKYKKK